MKISVIIPVYNVEEYLTQCIESVLMQSYDDKEILLINDGSTDGSKSICENYAENYTFIKLINKKNEGLSEARNDGILNASGDYLLFLDSDDFWSEDFLSDVVKILKKYKDLDFLFFRYKNFYQQKNIMVDSHLNMSEEMTKADGPTFLKHIFMHNPGFNWFAVLYLIKRDYIIQYQLFFEKGKKYEDMLWTPQIFLKAKSITYIDKSVYVYRRERTGSITSDFSSENLEDGIFISKFWYKKLMDDALDMDESLKMRLLNNLCTRYFVAIWFSGKLRKNERRNMIRLLKENDIFLKCGKGFVKKTTAFICRAFGFNVCIAICKSLWFVKHKLF